jgi:hypothetical protein
MSAAEHPPIEAKPETLIQECQNPEEHYSQVRTQSSQAVTMFHCGLNRTVPMLQMKDRKSMEQDA